VNAFERASDRDARGLVPVHGPEHEDARPGGIANPHDLDRPSLIGPAQKHRFPRLRGGRLGATAGKNGGEGQRYEDVAHRRRNLIALARAALR
jgi:hypothetical protein